MYNNIPLLVLEFQARSLYVQYLLQAESGIKEYTADWLPEAKKVMRDANGRFASTKAAITKPIKKTVSEVNRTIDAIKETGAISNDIIFSFLVDPGFRERVGLVAGRATLTAVEKIAEKYNADPRIVEYLENLTKEFTEKIARKFDGKDDILAKSIRKSGKEKLPENCSLNDKLEFIVGRYKSYIDVLQEPGFKSPTSDQEEIKRRKEILGNAVTAGIWLALIPSVLFSFGGVALSSLFIPEIGIGDYAIVFGRSLIDFFATITVEYQLEDKKINNPILKLLAYILGSVVVSNVFHVAYEGLVSTSREVARYIRNPRNFKQEMEECKKISDEIFEQSQKIYKRVKGMSQEDLNTFKSAIETVTKNDNDVRQALISIKGDKNLIDEALENYRKLIGDTKIAVRMPNEDILDQILKSRFKTTFENNARGASESSYSKWRHSVEKAMFGITKETTSDSSRPIYGYLVSKENYIKNTYEKEGKFTSGYGDIAVILDDSIRETATITGTDSFKNKGSSLLSNPGLASLYTETDIKTIPYISIFNARLKQIKEAKTLSEILGHTGLLKIAPYVETQIFGGVKGSDIKEIVFVDKLSGSSVNPILSKRIFGQDSIDHIIDKIQAKGIQVHSSEVRESFQKALADLGVENLSVISRRRDNFEEALKKFQVIDISDPLREEKINRLIADYRHSIATNVAIKLGVYKHKKVIYNASKTDSKTALAAILLKDDTNIIEEEAFRKGIFELNEKKVSKEYKEGIKLITNKIKQELPNFFDNIEVLTKKRIDFDL
jgi:hypothetical protein